MLWAREADQKLSRWASAARPEDLNQRRNLMTVAALVAMYGPNIMSYSKFVTRFVSGLKGPLICTMTCEWNGWWFKSFREEVQVVYENQWKHWGMIQNLGVEVKFQNPLKHNVFFGLATYLLFIDRKGVFSELPILCVFINLRGSSVHGCIWG